MYVYNNCTSKNTYYIIHNSENKYAFEGSCKRKLHPTQTLTYISLYRILYKTPNKDT